MKLACWGLLGKVCWVMFAVSGLLGQDFWICFAGSGLLGKVLSGLGLHGMGFKGSTAKFK